MWYNDYTLKLGNFEVPVIRLVPTIIATLEDIYKIKKKDRIKSKDLAILLGFKYGTETHYYRKLHALQAYGLLEGQGIFQVSELGEKILHPRNEQEKALSKTKAVLNIPLWNDIYQKHAKSPREDNFWAVLVDITKIDPDTAKKHATEIFRWYLDDIVHISEDSVEMKLDGDLQGETKPLSSTTRQSNQMSQQMADPKLDSSSDVEILSFDKYQVTLPKGDLSKEWEKLKKYMDIKLEGYKYEEQEQKEVKEDTKSGKEIIEEEQEKFDERMDQSSD